MAASPGVGPEVAAPGREMAVAGAEPGADPDAAPWAAAALRTAAMNPCLPVDERAVAVEGEKVEAVGVEVDQGPIGGLTPSCPGGSRRVGSQWRSSRSPSYMSGKSAVGPNSCGTGTSSIRR